MYTLAGTWCAAQSTRNPVQTLFIRNPAQLCSVSIFDLVHCDTVQVFAYRSHAMLIQHLIAGAFHCMLILCVLFTKGMGRLRQATRDCGQLKVGDHFDITSTRIASEDF